MDSLGTGRACCRSKQITHTFLFLSVAFSSIGYCPADSFPYEKSLRTKVEEIIEEQRLKKSEEMLNNSLH